MRRLAFSTAVLSAIVVGSVQTPVAAATTVCSNGSLLSVVDPTSGLPAACSLPSDIVLAQSLYYQNASKVGGSALAAYPWSTCSPA